jgi:hypothetical protein
VVGASSDFLCSDIVEIRETIKNDTASINRCDDSKICNDDDICL